MSPRRARQALARRSTQPRQTQPVDFWRPVAPLPEPEPITPATDPTVLLRSLGDPPLPRAGVVAGHHLATVIERAAAFAAALAASVDLLADTDTRARALHGDSDEGDGVGSGVVPKVR